MTDITASPIEQLRGLTSVRGIAAWWVVIFHFREVLPAGTPPGLLTVAAQGYLAVDLFFELSGFVIALNYAGRFRRFKLRSLLDFLGYRLARIYPLHMVMLGLFLLNPICIRLFSAASDPGPRYNPVYYLLSLSLMQNWGFTPEVAWNIPAWSISTEWFAYLLFPVLAWGLLRLVAGVAGGVLLAGGLLLGLAVTTAVFAGSLGADIPHFGLLRCVLEFSAGCCLWRLRDLGAAPNRHHSDVAALLALLCFGAYAGGGLPDYAVMPCGFLLLIYSLTCDAGILSRLLRSRLLESIGLVSYSTYLVHYFMKDWVKFVLVRPGVPQLLPIACYLLLTAAASVALHRWVEVPGRLLLRGLFRRERLGRPTRII